MANGGTLPNVGSGGGGGGGGTGGNVEFPTIFGNEPTLLNTYLVSAAGATILGIGFTASGAEVGISVVVPASAVPAAGNLADTIINSGAPQTGIVGAYFPSVGAAIIRYPGTIAEYVSGMGQTFPSGTSMTVGPVPPSYQAGPPTDSAGHLLTGVVDSSGTQLSVLATGNASQQAALVEVVQPPPVTLIASAAQTTTQQSADQTNVYGNAVLVALNVTAASGTGGLTVRFQWKDHLGNYHNINAAPAAVIATGQTTYILGLGCNSTGGEVVQANAVPLPKVWRINITVGDASSYTYSLVSQAVA